jgi:dihydrofolate reductase
VRKLILFSAVSLDNYIAKADGSVKWLDAPQFRLPGEDFGYKRFLSGIDTTIIGYKTYKQMLTFGPFPYQSTANYVLTRSSGRKDNDSVEFLHKDIPQFTKRLKRRRGKNIWLIGGSQANTLMLNHRLIDRMILTIVPVALGEGIPLFAESVRPASFILKKRNTFSNGFVQVTWDRR